MNNAIFAYETHKPSLDANLSQFDSARLFTSEALEFFRKLDGEETAILGDMRLDITDDGVVYYKVGSRNYTIVMVSVVDGAIIAKGDNVMEAVAATENYIKRVKG